jgi:hypothetical protein
MWPQRRDRRRFGPTSATSTIESAGAILATRSPGSISAQFELVVIAVNPGPGAHLEEAQFLLHHPDFIVDTRSSPC